MRALRSVISVSACCLSLLLVGCGSDGVGSEEQARLAYIGLDQAIEKSLGLGLDGFNEATSANIPAQSTTGAVGGTLTITGQVDQGNSDNKGMRLRMGLVDYTDGKVPKDAQAGSFELGQGADDVEIIYDTAASPETQPELDLSLKDAPNGTFTGSVAGSFDLKGDLEGAVALDLTFSGTLEDDGTGKARRVVGGTTITGTATSEGESYAVDVTR